MISVIVPVYQVEKVLSRCIESILNQTYCELEILLIDDGSTDGSGMICDSYAKKDNRIKVLHKKNAGVSAARNSGIEMALGEYIQFVDSDDYLDKTCCEQMWNTVDKSGAKLIVCGFHHWYYGKDVIKVPKQEGAFLLSQMEEELLDLYDQGFLNMPWNKLFFRADIKEHFDIGLSLGEDLIFNLDYMKQLESIALVKEPLYHYIQEANSNSLSAKKREDKLEISVRVKVKIKQFYMDKMGHAPNRPVIEERFLREFLDEIESLPSDRGLGIVEKMKVIAQYSRQKEIEEAGKIVTFHQIDYRILHWFLKKHAVWLVLFFAYLRSGLLRLIRRGK